MSPFPDAGRVADIIRDVAKTEILPRFQSLADADIETKSSGEPVTIADKQSEYRLTERLRELLPGSLVIGEEATERKPQLLDAIDGDDPVWIIDPIDGTKNYAAGRSPFVVIVALCRRGETVMGWIYEPLENRLALTEKNAGAEIGGPVDFRAARLAREKPLQQMHGYCDEYLVPAAMNGAVDSLRRDCAGLSYHNCLGYEYLELASGRGDFSVIGRLDPWDHAAGTLIFREAGGIAKCIDGRAYSPRIRKGVLLLAPDESTWNIIEHALNIGGGDREVSP